MHAQCFERVQERGARSNQKIIVASPAHALPSNRVGLRPQRDFCRGL
jgi:hypothetical protein